MQALQVLKSGLFAIALISSTAIFSQTKMMKENTEMVGGAVM